jgi:hypothetical protein
LVGLLKSSSDHMIGAVLFFAKNLFLPNCSDTITLCCNADA